MLQRPSSRLLVVDSRRRILLFRFEHRNGPLSGLIFWATPGGAVDEGESFEDAARRELFEEVGLKVTDPGAQVARRIAVFALPSGEMVESDERYFVVRVDGLTVSSANWTPLEHEVMAAHRWWDRADLAAATEQVWPENLTDILIAAGVWTADT